MKKIYKRHLKDKEIEREYEYIPVRFILGLLLTLFEIAGMIGVVIALCYYVPYFYVLAVITQVVCVVKIISSDDNPDYKAPWLLVVLVLPVAGFMLYFILYSRKLQKKYVKRLQFLSTKNYKKDDTNILNELKNDNETAYTHAKALCKIADTHIFENVKQDYFSSGEDIFPCMIEDLKNAKKFIFLEYYIIEEGKYWNTVLEILKQKISEGVEIKVVFDDFGCMRTLPGNYASQLEKMGISAVPFSRLKGYSNNEFNNRTHRKMLIIDGYIAYTGGVNLADEYINECERFGYWKDCGIRLEGECVWEYVELFLTDYGLNVKKLPKIRKDLYTPCIHEGEKGYVIPFGNGPTPLYERRVAKSAIQNMIDSATKYCYITTPYLIPDNDLCVSLENAALKGVDVRIVTPAIPDKKIVFYISRSYYHRLMKAGVKIYEYTPGFIHAKTYLADDIYAIIGSANLDYRSLAHNYENGIWLYKTNSIKDIKADLEKTIEQSALVQKENFKLSPIEKFVSGIVRIFAPLM